MLGSLLAFATPGWVSTLPEPLAAAVAWLLSPAVLGALGLASLAMLAASAFGLPWLLARLPADHFLASGRPDPTNAERPGAAVAWAIARNAVGLLLLVAGLAMLVLPGQGLLTLVVALLLLDFPGKVALQRRLVANDAVFRGLNALRRRMHVAPFKRR